MLGNEQRSRGTPKQAPRKRGDWLAEPYRSNAAAILIGRPVLELHHEGCPSRKYVRKILKAFSYIIMSRNKTEG